MGGRLRGVLQAFAASFTISVSSAVVKSSSVPIGQVTFLANLVALCLVLPVALYKGHNLFPRGYRKRLVLASIFDVVLVLCDYEAMRLMPLADEAVMAYTSVIFTVLLARIFLRESFSREKLICSFGIIAGVALISSPAASHSAYPLYGLGCCLTIVGAFSDAIIYIFIKDLSTLPSSVLMVSFGVVTLIITGPMSLIETWIVPKDPINLTLIIVLTFLQDIFIILALRSEEAGLVSFVQATDIVFSYIWELAFFDEPYSVQRVLGAVVVCSVVVLAAMLQKKPSQSILEGKELPLVLKSKDSKLHSQTTLRAAEVFKWLHLRER